MIGVITLISIEDYWSMNCPKLRSVWIKYGLICIIANQNPHILTCHNHIWNPLRQCELILQLWRSFSLLFASKFSWGAFGWKIGLMKCLFTSIWLNQVHKQNLKPWVMVRDIIFSRFCSKNWDPMNVTLYLDNTVAINIYSQSRFRHNSHETKHIEVGRHFIDMS